MTGSFTVHWWREPPSPTSSNEEVTDLLGKATLRGGY